MNRKINVGIIGFGLSGKAFHAPFMHVHPGFEIKKVVEHHKSESNKLYPYVEVVKDYKNVLADPEIGLVAHCTPNALHYPLVKESLEAGKHVIIEKPFTNTSKEADELIDLAAKKGLQIFVFQNRRWDGDFLTIKKLLKSGAIGEIEYYEAHFDRNSPEIKEDAWREAPAPGSGVLYDLGAHLIDQALMLFGMPKTIRATIEAQRKNSAVDDYFKVRLIYPDKRAVLTAGVLVEELGPRYIIHGARGSFIKYGIDPQEALLRKGILPGGEDWGQESPDRWGLVTIDYDDLNFDGRIETEEGNYMGFYNNVYDVLTNNAEIMVKPAEARNVIRIIELAFESAKLGLEIKVES